VTKGTKLAQQPKKFQRIAKANAQNRPEHIEIVERLYQANSSKKDKFRMTYDELARVYSSRPELRKQAHVYLVAYDTMQGDVLEPTA